MAVHPRRQPTWTSWRTAAIAKAVASRETSVPTVTIAFRDWPVSTSGFSYSGM